MSKPIIGISGSILVDKSGSFAGYRRSYVNEDYVKSVIKNGGVPYIIPMNNDVEIIRDQITCVDGLILSGGHDVSPIYYNQEPDKKLCEILPERDLFDFKLIEFAKEKNIPILGICRGLQILNVYHGGTLFQDLSMYDKSKVKHDQVVSPTVATHTVDLADKTELKRILKKNSIMVNSFHHQIINKLADNLVATAYSKDGVVEAIECPEYKFMMAVQWHPEMLHEVDEQMNLIFKELIENAKLGGT